MFMLGSLTRRLLAVARPPRLVLGLHEAATNLLALLAIALQKLANVAKACQFIGIGVPKYLMRLSQNA
jgi:hypothetical protein